MAEEEKPAVEEKKGKGLLFVIIGVVIAVLILVGVVVFLFMGGEEDGDHHGGGEQTATVQVANLTPEQQALLQNEAYKNPRAIQPLEKEFVINLKSPNPDDMREGGYAKFKATLLLDDKHTVKEVEAKLDIVRNVITDVTSGFSASELQTSQGRHKLANNVATSLNAVLTDGKVSAVVFPDFMLQP